MTDHPEHPDNDPAQAIWQGQDLETPAMTLQAIRMLVRNDREHVRNGLLFGLGLIVVEGLAFGRVALIAKNDVMRAGVLIVILGLAWMGWRMWRRPWGDRRLPDAAATTQTLIAFHRDQLARRRVSYGWMMITVAPVFVGVAVSFYGGWLLKRGPLLPHLGPLVALCGLWFIAAWFIQRRQSRRLQEQIDDLDQMGRS
jgi:threonine/homoserine/homoserine lactone efflux protein